MKSPKVVLRPHSVRVKYTGSVHMHSDEERHTPLGKISGLYMVNCVDIYTASYTGINQYFAILYLRKIGADLLSGNEFDIAQYEFGL